MAMPDPEVANTAAHARRVGDADLAVTPMGDATITREVMNPGWRWSKDVKPIVRTDLCRALHQFCVLSGRLHVVMEDGAEFEVGAGDAGVIPPGHDAWVLGDEPCDLLDFSPVYAQLIAAGEAYLAMTELGEAGASCSRTQAAMSLRAEATAGRLDAAAVELVLGAVGHRPRRVQGPAGLTRRELEVLVLIATGASAKQVAYALGITPKTAATHIERIYIKIGVSTRSDATRFAIAHGLVTPIALGPSNSGGPAQTFAPVQPASPLDELSAREREVLALLAEGLSDRVIGERLHISAHTAHRHVSNIFTKLGVRTRAAAAALGARHGIS
jgi:DNA-binding CsgD family transcriptional regulator/mannose-6-phosphate isomerase-like protein (cupin superfamily)